MPAAAVIPAPIAYIKVVAVKKLVVGSWIRVSRSEQCLCTAIALSVFSEARRCPLLGAVGCRSVYFEKIRVFKADTFVRIILHGIME